jgi:predicted nucleotidyltransferase
MDKQINQAVEIMKNCIADILEDNQPSIYLYGSVVLDDFKFGWSDIDLLCLTEKPITDEQAVRYYHFGRN